MGGNEKSNAQTWIKLLWETPDHAHQTSILTLVRERPANHSSTANHPHVRSQRAICLCSRDTQQSLTRQSRERLNAAGKAQIKTSRPSHGCNQCKSIAIADLVRGTLCRDISRKSHLMSGTPSRQDPPQRSPKGSTLKVRTGFDGHRDVTYRTEIDGFGHWRFCRSSRSIWDLGRSTGVSSGWKSSS